MFNEHIGLSRFSAATTLNNWPSELVTLQCSAEKSVSLKCTTYFMATAIPNVKDLPLQGNAPNQNEKLLKSLLMNKTKTPKAVIWPPNSLCVYPTYGICGMHQKAWSTEATPCNPQDPRDPLPISQCQTQNDTLRSPVFITRVRTVFAAQEGLT